MSKLTFVQKQRLENILGMSSGYVLDFSDRTFAECVKDATGIDINLPKFSVNGNSKAKRLRYFWTVESDEIVGKLLLAFSEYKSNEEIKDIANHLLGKNIPKVSSIEDVPLPKIDISKLGLYSGLEETIIQRIKEIEVCLKSGAFLSVIFLSGSTLEGILLNFITGNSKNFNQIKVIPKNKDGVIRKVSDWTLNDMINVLHEAGIFDLNIYKFSHALREFRNYIHPFQQASQKFTPDKHTAEISYKVLLLAIDKISIN